MVKIKGWLDLLPERVAAWDGQGVAGMGRGRVRMGARDGEVLVGTGVYWCVLVCTGGGN